MGSKTREMPKILTPEVVESLAKNAEPLKSVLSSGDEASALKGSNCTTCCCPRLLKFKFVLCNVYIINENAECSHDD